LTLFTAAGIFSSRIVSATNSEALFRSPHCYRWTTFDSSAATQNATLLDINTIARVGATYAESCYNTASTSSTCAVYATRQITSSLSIGAPCPFKSTICQTVVQGKSRYTWDKELAIVDKSAIEIDSGLIASDLHLGINTLPDDRVTYQRKLTCSPIAKQGFEVSTTDPTTKDIHYYYFYGPPLNADPIIGHTTGTTDPILSLPRGNWTYEVTLTNATYRSGYNLE